jgi:ferrous iron transport protein B
METSSRLEPDRPAEGRSSSGPLVRGLEQSSVAEAAPVTSVSAAPEPAVVLVGNPNVGKSVVFGALTGTYVAVSNYPGTTVEVSRGHATLEGVRFSVLDTPGTNNLVPISEDEAVTRDILLSEKGYRVLQVCDAKNLKRGLLLSAQLSEAGVPFSLCLNMADEARERGIHLEGEELAKALGVPVFQTVAVHGEGLDELPRLVRHARAGAPQLSYASAIEAAAKRVEELVPKDLALAPRALALMALASSEREDPTLWARLSGLLSAGALAEIRALREEAERAVGEPLRFAIARTRILWADAVTRRVQSRSGERGAASLAQRLGELAVHPVLGFPILAAVLFVAYEFVGVLGAGTLVDLLEHKVFANHLVPWTEALVRAVTPAGAVQHFLVGDPGQAATSGGLLVGKYGLVSMALSYGIAIVLPIVTTFFIFFSVLEDSGYLPRLAVVLNKAFKAMGLNGKAVLPMVLGLGCDTMATMTTRILETRKERVIVTLLLALGVPCSAQLGVILGMLSGLSLWGALWWGGSVASTIVLVGYLAAKVLPGRGSDFLLEVPPIRRPLLSNIAVKTLARIEWYLKEALPLFVFGTLVLWVLDRFGLIAGIERACAPVVQGVLGLPRQATAAFVVGFLRRDYGAAGLFELFQPAMRLGHLPRETEIQLVVSMVTITLFIPCIANFLMIIKERGLKTGLAIAGFIVPFAVGVGGLVNLAMHHL